MKRLISIFVIAISVMLGQQLQPFTGSILGGLKGEDGTVIAGAPVILHFTGPVKARYSHQRTAWSAVTTSAGDFQFTGLPEGNYALCPHTPNSAWLSPCDWNLPIPAASISRLAPSVKVTITLKRGAVVPIRIDDAGQLLTQHEGKTPGAGLLLGVSSPGFIFHPVPLTSKDSSGRNYQIVLPFNTALTLVIHPSFYHVNNASSVALSQTASTKIPLLVAAGQQVSPIKFTITGAGH
jgi:hypothetical protein